MSLRPHSYEEAVRRAREQQERKREAARRYQDKVKDEVLSGEREWSSLERTGPVNPVNPERKKKRFKHHYGSKERARFFREQPCDSCGKEPTDEHPSHNHHVRTGGMGTKAHHRWIIPLCSDCHRAMHGKDPPMGPQTARAQAELWAGRWAKHTEDG